MQHILAAVDFSESTQAVLQNAVQLAEAFSAKLWLIHVAAPEPDFVGYEAGPQTVRDQVAAHLQKEHRELQNHAETVRQSGVEVTPLLVQGQTVATLLNEANRIPASLIIVGSHGHGALYRALVGSVTEGLLRKANCPVVVIPRSLPRV